MSFKALWFTLTFLGCQNSMFAFHHDVCHCHVWMYSEFPVLSSQIYFSPIQINRIYIFFKNAKNLQSLIIFLMYIINIHTIKRNLVLSLQAWQVIA
jgi:hypothetical protein